MARLTGPESGSRLAYEVTGTGALRAAVGLVAAVYADEDAEDLADILTVDGDPITGSQVTVGADSQLPLFQFPDGVDQLWARITTGPVTAIYARAAAAASGVSSVDDQTGDVDLTDSYAPLSAAAELAAHEADSTGVHGIADTAALETSTGSTAKVTAHAGASDPHGDRSFTTTAIATHTAATDPHGDRAYAAGQAGTALAGAEAYTDAAIATVDLALGDKADLVGGKLDQAQLPDIAIVQYLGQAVNQAAMLALAGQSGDWTIRTDLSTVWIITGSDPTQLANWTQLGYPTAPVTSVAGRTGAVSLAKADVGLGNVDNTADASKAFDGSQITAGTVAFARLPTGATSTTVTVGNDSRLSDSRAPTGAAGGDLTGTYPNPTLGATILAAVRARSSHTGTQTASTISDFDSQVRTSRLDQMTAPGADVSMASHKLTSVTDPTSAQDAATKNYVDSAGYGTWTDIASLGTNTGHGTPHAQSRTAPGGKTELRGQLLFSGAISANATIATLPAGQLPYGAVTFGVRWGGTGSANTFLNIDTSGHLSVSTASLVNTNTLNLDGIWFSHA